MAAALYFAAHQTQPGTDLHIEPMQTKIRVRGRVDALGEYVRARPIKELDNLDMFFFMRAPFYRPYAWNRSNHCGYQWYGECLGCRYHHVYPCGQL